MAGRSKFVLIFAPEVFEHLDAIEAKYHPLIERTANQQLIHTPERATRNRKPLDAAGPQGSTWELRFGPQNCFRVFYDVDRGAQEVHILAIGIKDHEKLFIGGEEYTP